MVLHESSVNKHMNEGEKNLLSSFFKTNLENV